MPSTAPNIRSQPWQVREQEAADFGLIVLENDSVSAPTLQGLFGARAHAQVARMRLLRQAKSIGALEKSLRDASASILPDSPPGIIALSCTTAAMQLGHTRIQAAFNRPGSRIVAIDPLAAGFAAARYLKLRRMAILSPYSAAVSGDLADAFIRNGIPVTEVGHFGAKDAEIMSIAGWSIMAAAEQLAKSNVDGLFLSCTGMRAVPFVSHIERRIGIPVLTSLSVLAWEIGRGLYIPAKGPGRLFAGPQGEGRRRATGAFH